MGDTHSSVCVSTPPAPGTYSSSSSSSSSNSKRRTDGNVGRSFSRIALLCCVDTGEGDGAEVVLLEHPQAVAVAVVERVLGCCFVLFIVLGTDRVNDVPERGWGNSVNGLLGDCRHRCAAGDVDLDLLCSQPASNSDHSLSCSTWVRVHACRRQLGATSKHDAATAACALC